MSYHTKTLDTKVDPPDFDPPGLLREVKFLYNEYVNFMVSNMKIGPKNPSRPIFRETFILPSCPN